MGEDGESLAAFLARVEVRALRVAQLHTAQRADALDAVQDAMLALARRYGHRPSPEWPALFFRILENGLRDQHRRARTWRRLFVAAAPPAENTDDAAAAPGPPDAVDPAPGPHGALAAQREQARLRAALATLPARQREAVALRVLAELSVADTARAMAVSEGSVKTHLSRGLAALRARLGELA